MVHTGQYWSKDGYIAFRDNTESTWRLSRSSVNPDTSQNLTYIDSFTTLWEIEDYIEQQRQI